MDKKRVIYQIKNLNHLIIRYTCKKSLENENFPTQTQMQIIHYMCSNKGKKVYQKDIGNALNLRRATLSEVLKTMEKNELISKITDKADTRVKQIILSEKAKQKFEFVKNSFDQTENALIKDIDPKDLETFLNVINKMQENLKNERMNIC